MRFILPKKKEIILPKYQRGNFAMFPAGTAAAASAGGVTYSLQGTSGTPVISSRVTTSPTDCLTGWYFETNSNVDKINGSGSRTFDHDWVDGVPPDIWIHADNHLGDDPNQGDSLNTWLQLTGAGGAERSWRWNETTNGFATLSGTIRVRLSTDSSGTTIVDTGYYRGVSSVEL